MNDDHFKDYTEEEIASMARNIGKPLPGDLKKRIMDKVHARSIELTQAPKPEIKPDKKPERKHRRGRTM